MQPQSIVRATAYRYEHVCVTVDVRVCANMNEKCARMKSTPVNRIAVLTFPHSAAQLTTHQPLPSRAAII